MADVQSNRLTFVERVSVGKARYRCSCGNEKVIQISKVRNGVTRSCSCLAREVRSRQLTTHGQRNTRLYHIWVNMRQRCQNPKADAFADYGGRGIRVCDDWQSFEAFLTWATSHGYTDCLTIDREDNNGNYEPRNCRWVTMKVNARNRRNSRLLTHLGKTQSAAAWADELGLSRSCIYQRLGKGWSVSAVLETPRLHA